MRRSRGTIAVAHFVHIFSPCFPHTSPKIIFIYSRAVDPAAVEEGVIKRRCEIACEKTFFHTRPVCVRLAARV